MKCENYSKGRLEHEKNKKDNLFDGNNALSVKAAGSCGSKYVSFKSKNFKWNNNVGLCVFWKLSSKRCNG
jgi:hypothetical protein